MTDSTNQRHPRRTTAIIVVVLVLVIAAVAAIGVLTAGSAKPAATGTTSVPAPSASAVVPTASTTPSSSATPTKRFTPAPAVTATAPQPTRTAAISSAAPITKSLSAAVTKMEAVQGTATGPGEIAGPSVRFTVVIRNTTGKSFDLSNTVVNAYSGADSAPAIQLQGPGGKSFPSSVASGGSATGVFVFNIPESDRNRVEITVDTSVLNPVVAFKGSAPR